MALARRLLALALAALGAAAVSQCGGAVQASTSFEGVLGVESDCASRAREIAVDVRTGEAVELAKTFAVGSPADLPIAVALPSLAGGQASHEVRVTFRLAAADASGALTTTTIGPYRYDDGTSGRVLYVLPCTCVGIACPGGETCAELPVGSGRAVCRKPPSCGDHTCDPGEPVTCPDDCAASCSGDGHCDEGESCETCPLDCGFCCGDGQCEGGETAASCPSDCGAVKPPCGDGTCDAGEDCASCAADCCCSDPCCVSPGPCCGSDDPCCGKYLDGEPCSAAAECCSSNCQGAKCSPPCGADGGPCTSGAQCCSGLCKSGVCVEPPPRVTQVVVNAANDVHSPPFANTAQLFFVTDADMFWDEAKSLRVPFPNTGGNVDLVFDFAAHPQWTGTIRGLRFDPFDCTQSPACDAACFNVDTITLRDASGAPVSGQLWTFDGPAQNPIPSPYFGWDLVGLTTTWSQGGLFGGCVDPLAVPYGDPQIRDASVIFATQP
jgi:hypothetical protein